MTEDNDLVIENLKRAVSIFEEMFGERLTELAKIDARRVSILKLMHDDKEFLVNDQDASLVRIIKETWKMSNKNFLAFLRSLRSKKIQIRIFESELASYILSELDRTETEFGGDFSKLIDMYINILTFPEENYIVSYIKTPPHRAELENAISKIKNKKIADVIRKAIIDLINEEMEYLVRYLDEVSSWNNKEAITEDLQFFTAKVSSFLYGRGEQYPGLFTKFKDEKLEQTIKSNPAYLQFSRYNLQLLYLRRLREKIKTYQQEQK